MPRKKTRKRPAAPLVLSGVYGVHRVGSWDLWVAWVDGSDPSGCLSAKPDAWGWVAAPTVAATIISTLFGVALGVESDPAAIAAVDALAFHGVAHATREDALAVNAYHRYRPAVPVGHTVAAPPTTSPAQQQPPWWVVELACPWPPTRAQVVEAYRARAQVLHPDRPGGSAASFDRARRAYEAAIGWVAGREEQG